jgi:hypothetical protein
MKLHQVVSIPYALAEIVYSKYFLSAWIDLPCHTPELDAQEDFSMYLMGGEL